MKVLSLLALLLASTSAHAAAIGTCDNLDSIGNLVGNTKSFNEGNLSVRVAYISTEEPASSPDHLLVFVYDDHMGYTCASVDATENRDGFGSIDMTKITGKYDRTKGLLITVPANVWTGEDGKYRTVQLKVRVKRVNEDEATVTLE